jgi:hypothetical protein
LISKEGDVRYGTSSGLAVLDMVVDPQVYRPVRRIDDELLHRMDRALPMVEEGVGEATVFRRDGVASHLTAHVRTVMMGGSRGLAILFHTGECEGMEGIDEIWNSLLLSAAQEQGGLRRLGLG